MEPWAPHGADAKPTWRLCSCSVCARWENPGVLPGAKSTGIKEPKYQRAQENMGFLSRCFGIPVVPHKAAAEVSKIGHYKRRESL